VLRDGKPNHEHQVLAQENLGVTKAWLEHSPHESLLHLAQEIGVLREMTKTATKLLIQQPYKITVIHTFQPCDSVIFVNGIFSQFMIANLIPS
jgi:hypothetical protein